MFPTAIFEYFYILTPERKNCGTDVLTVSHALGHSQSTTTLNIYMLIHSVPPRQKQVKQSLTPCRSSQRKKTKKRPL